MARSFWKGNYYLEPLYTNFLVRQSQVSSALKLAFPNGGSFNLKDNSVFVSSMKYYQRNQKITSHLLNFLNILSIKVFKIYNGYDFLKRLMTKDLIGRSMSELVSTRELNVVHKTKLSKAARKHQQLKSNKKRNMVVTKAGFKAKKPLNKNRKK